MAGRTLALCLLASAAALCFAAAADEHMMLGDKLALGGFSSKAKAASYYQDKAEIACVSQTNMKNCRYTGCPVQQRFAGCKCCGECEACERRREEEEDPNKAVEKPVRGCHHCLPDSIFFQTDFTCCAKEGYGSNDNIGIVGADNQIATCDWEFSLYRTSGRGRGYRRDRYKPVPSADGTALKWGTVWGTCYLNTGADNCDHPLCERMAISIQGGLYTTCAYSPDYFVALAPPETECASNPPSDPESDPEEIDEDEELDEQPAPVAKSDEATAKLLLGGDLDEPFRQVARKIVRGSFQLAQKCGFDGLRDNFGKTPTDQSVKSANGNGQTEGYFPGVALMISGPMSTSSKKDLRVEENGLFELTLAFALIDERVANPANMWPVVHGRSAKLRFTREEPHEGPHY